MKKIFIINILIFLLSSYTSFSQTTPPSQTTGGIIRQEEEVSKEEELRKKIEEEKKSEIITQEISAEKEKVGEKVLIKKIIVEGITLIPHKEIDKITSQFEGKELSLKDMQKIADLITNEYRKRGYLTSFAYLPPQEIKNGVLIIRVIEGRVGEIKIEGNKYFKKKLLRSKIDLKSGGYFDYSKLQKSLVYINEHPDRIAKAILIPGKKPGTTDIIIKVKDRSPVHIGFEYDNFGSRYIERDRTSVVFEHNNFLGFDDKLYFKFQQSEAALLRAKYFRYIVPITRTLEGGVYLLRNNVKLGREFKDVESRGKATVISVFLNKSLVSKEDIDLRLNLGFDYKHIRNYLLGVESSRDEVRVFKTGLDIDFTDKWARNIVVLELDVGIPRMMGGLASKDPLASRAGAGGRFFKLTGNYFRLQPFLFSSTLLWKNYFQFSPYNLVASEQFQIGGPISVRGYPVAEYSADKGWYTSLEWSFPIYFLPKNLKVPFSGGNTLYDSLNVVVFYDWATAHLNKVLAGEKQHRTIKGYGFGIRFNPTERISFRIEVGFPIKGPEPSDNKSCCPWIEFKYKF